MKKRHCIYILIAALTASLKSAPTTLRYDRDGALGYSIHGGYRKLPRSGYIRCG